MKIGYLISIETPGLWGIGKRGFEADILTHRCKIKDIEIPCIPSTSIKGVLRKTALQLSSLLQKANIITNTDIINKVFGKEGEAYTPLTLTDVIPVKDVEVAKKAFNEGIHVLMDNVIGIPVVTIPHVRIDDKSLTAAKEALFFEERLAIGVQLYGEIQLYDRLLKENEVVEAARILLLSLSDLRYRYIGRRTIVDVKIIGILPSNLLEDEYVSFIYNSLSVR